MNHSEEIPLSALQHWIFCSRQYALIHIERLWAENRFTAEGRVLHDRVDGGGVESRSGVRILRAVHVHSDRHRLHGVADVVELRGGIPYPVEYKRGRPKAHRADEVQLCAQVLCLEEMFGCTIPEGALFYGKTRRRQTVALDDTLRKLTLDTAAGIRACLDSGRLPQPTYDPARCDCCSLIAPCQPRLPGASQDVKNWLARAVANPGAPE
ncbi:CRISPR-associated protein Cas4 [Ruegeria sediminis]|uniref:CRISPR-associated protein Cas4 n=1 Tax=Ruegeria sediminis TaxID=2583820 RepID=UPI001FE7A45A|nr:CRISPR-associated protein Cas4 [Ruegeria sediminis]